MLTFLYAAFKLLAGPARFLFTELTSWAETRGRIKAAEADAKLAEITARTELAAYKIQSDLNWDLAWAGQAPNTWKDEYLIILWSAPMWPALVALPLDVFMGTTYTSDILTLLSRLQAVTPDILQWWMVGWGIIFSAVYGNKAAGQVMMGSKVSKIAEAFKELPDEIPTEAVSAVTDRIKAVIAARKGHEVEPKRESGR